MADKLLLVTTFVVLTLPGLGLANPLPVWLTVLIIFRDVCIVLTVAIVNLVRVVMISSRCGAVRRNGYVLSTCGRASARPRSGATILT